MKRIIASIFTVLLIANISFAFTTEQKVELAKRQYKHALKSDNTQLRHSAIYRIAQLKSQLPSTDFSDLRKPLLKVAQKDEVPWIRTHALLTSMMTSFIKKSSLFLKVNKKTMRISMLS